jgi:hypothetical protein
MAMDSQYAPALPEGARAVSAFYRLDASGAAPDRARIRLPLADLPSPAQPVLLSADETGTWQVVDDARREGSTLSGTLVHFGYVVAVIMEGAPSTRRAKVQVGSPPMAQAISLSRPADTTVTPGSRAQFTVRASGMGPGDQAEWVSTSGHAEPASCAAELSNWIYYTCKTWPATLAQSGATFRLRVSRGDKVVESSAAKLTVLASPVLELGTPSPATATVQAGQSAVFNAAVQGTGPFSWQWLKDGQPVTGANGSSFEVSTTTAEAGRKFRIQVRVRNPQLDWKTSPPAELTVTASGGTLVRASEGGSLSAPDGMNLIVPPGALPADTLLSFSREPVPANLLPADFTALSGIVRVLPTNIAWRAPVVMEFPLPEEVPTGYTLALISLEEVNAVRAMAASTSAPVRAAALAAITQAACSNIQNADSNRRLGRGFLAAARQIAVQLPTSACSTIEPRVSTPELPSLTDEECTKAGDYVMSEEAALVSRHVSCQMAQSIGNEIDVDLLKKDGNETYQVITNPSAATPAGYTRLTKSFSDTAWVEVQLSVYGPSNGLSKRVSVKARLRNVVRASDYPANAPAVTSVTVRPVIACVGNVPCADMVAGEMSLPINGDWGPSVKVNANLSVDPQSKRSEVRFYLKGMDYKALGNAYGLAGNPSVNRGWSLNMPTSPTLTCDSGLTWGATAGCVFEEAAAVWVPGADVSVIRTHIRQAMNGVSNNQGRYEGKDGSRALPDGASLGRLLQRTRVISEIKANRAETRRQCRDAKPLVCETNDPDDAVLAGSCDCDEYPFASTRQGGGMSKDTLSVSSLNAKQNQLAGSQLGSFYRKQRIKDGSAFWVKPD